VKGSAIPRLPLAALLLLVAWDASPQSPHPPGWKGTREVRDGVVYVHNPSEPAEGRVEYELQEMWRIPSEAEDGTLNFGVVENIVEDHQGNVLVLDSQLLRILVISPSGEVIRTMGREGDGPGEFRRPTGLCVHSDGSIAILEPQAHRGVLFSPDGEPLREWRVTLDGTPGARIMDAMPTKDLYALELVTHFAQNDEVRLTRAVHVFSADGAMLTELLRQHRVMPRTRPPRVVEETEADLSLFDADDSGRVLVSPTWRDYCLHIYDADSGALRMVVTRDFEPLNRSSEEIEEQRGYTEARYGGRDRVEAVISPVHRTVSEADLHSDGTMWVASSRGWKQVGVGEAIRYDVFDNAGRFLREAVLLGDVSPDDDVSYLLGDRFVNVEAREIAADAEMDLGRRQSGGEESARTRIVCYRLLRSSDDGRQPTQRIR